ncbi:MAG: UDP-N-acetylmuramate--L-alanine ligase, partial [Deltaproteobacteria bacterium]|nr:UDP-N-acetylmuramate--L-alanine ligase [Deltaproteobacteria bacterium]
MKPKVWPCGLRIRNVYKHKIKRVHMVGIGGAGMCGIAEVLHNMGFVVSGSDLKDGASLRHLRDLGVNIAIGHAAGNVADPHVLVKSTAIEENNVEVAEARVRSIPVISRAEMLAEISRLRNSIFIGGTHGKTTTTALVAAIMEEAGFDPTVIIGGRLNAYGANARLGAGDYLVAEADESDGSFLCLFPIINVITNIDADHLDFYGDQAHIDRAFVDFMNKAPFYGLNVVCGDDPGLRRVLPLVKRPLLTYGLDAGSDLEAEVLELGESSRFSVRFKGSPLGEFCLSQPGRHNILNALAAIGVALQTDIPAEACRRGLAKFRGVGRRFERKGERAGIILVDDYGHHPTEILATLDT